MPHDITELRERFLGGGSGENLSEGARNRAAPTRSGSWRPAESTIHESQGRLPWSGARISAAAAPGRSDAGSVVPLLAMTADSM
jgi:hypothetical protein